MFRAFRVPKRSAAGGKVMSSTHVAPELLAENTALRAEVERLSHRFSKLNVERLERKLKRAEAEVERLRGMWEEKSLAHANAHAARREAEDKLKAVVKALQETSYAADLLSRALKGWAQPITGMGANISIEDKGRWLMALHQWEDKARPLVDAALAAAKGKPNV